MSLSIPKHKNVMVSILKDIYSDTAIGPILGFKGGTAALLCYDLPRFSVDLDFDLLDQGKEDLVFARVGKILAEQGIVKDASKKRFTLFWQLSYEPGEHTIKIEISRRMPVMASRYHKESYLGIPMSVMIKEDMSANKLLAMHERMVRARRDVFDVHYFLKSRWAVNKALVEDRSKLPYKDFLRSCIERLEKLSDNDMLAGLGELLEEKQKQWVREKLKPETLFQLRLALETEKKSV